MALPVEGLTMEEMPAWPKWLRIPAPSRALGETLLGVPALRRIKNYAALSGYVYEYFFEGYRDVRGAREFVFSISGNRKSWSAFEVRLAEEATKEWERERGLVLGNRERYAVAKFALFSTLDERADPTQMLGSLNVTSEMAVAFLDQLDL